MKIIVTYLTGIGNTILCIPALRALRRKFPDADIDAVVRHQASKEILERITCARQIYVFNPAEQKTLSQKFALLSMLRRERYDVNLTMFPSNRAEFNLLSFLIGAKRRIAPRYQVGYLETLAFLQTELVELNVTAHDIEQNLSLLSPLGISKILWNGRDISWHITEEEQHAAEQALVQMHLSPHDLLIGFHLGCNPNQGNLLKRWPVESFAQLGDRLIEKTGAKILIFGDQQEQVLKDQIRQLMHYPPHIPETMPLLKTAALIKLCRLFVTNDSGLMHVAAAMGVPTISLFGPSDPQRNAPWGEGHTLIKSDVSCAPCNKYPHYQAGGSFIRCRYRGEQKGICLTGISVERVYQTIIQHYTDLVTPTVV